MQTVLYKKTPLFFGNVFPVTFCAHVTLPRFNKNVLQDNSLVTYIYILNNKEIYSKLYAALAVVWRDIFTQQQVQHQALCACMRAVLYKKTPRFLEMFSL